MERTAPGGRGEEERAMVKMERNGEEMVIAMMRWQVGHVGGGWGGGTGRTAVVYDT